jgi:UDP-glucose:(heptosyl)LPS alpha-1,3-glucosyltransferase
MKKKIALIIERANIILGGAERSAFELSTALEAVGFEVDILVAKGEKSIKNIHVLCQSTSGNRTGHHTFAKALKKHFSSNKYDIIHSFLPFDFADIYQPRGGSFTEAALRNAASYRNKFIESYKKTTSLFNFRRTTLLRAEKRLCKNPNGPIVAALSKYVAEQFKSHYGLTNERIVVIPNRVNTNKKADVSEANKLRSQVITRFGLKETDNSVVFLFAANNFRLKGLACLIETMQLVQNQNTARAAFLIVTGSGKPHKYRQLAKRLNVHQKIIFLGPIQNIQDVLSISDVAILPTFYDPSSRFILEAIAADKPVITTRFNGAIDLFIDKRHGLVINSPEDINALAEAMRFFTNTDNIKKASQAIIEDNLKEKVSINRVTKQLQFFYESILEKRGGK